MKKFLLSIFCCLMAVFSVQADEVTFTATATGTAGTSGSGGVIVLSNDVVQVTLSKAYSNGTQFRIYQNCSLTILGKNATVTKVSFTAYDGKTGAITLKSGGGSVTSSGSVRSWAGSSNEVVLNANAQIRTLSITITYTTNGETPDAPVAPDAPTLPAACSFDNAMIVEITDVAEGATAYYSLNNETNWVEGTSVEITETTTVYAKVVKDELSSTVVNARYTKNVVIEGGIIDVLNIELTGITKGSTEYKSWNGKQVISSAVYAGQSAGDNDAIQLRSSSSNSGIVTTASGGNVKKIVVDWNSATASGRTLQVYGKNSAYSAPTELYATSGNTEQGELLGEIVCGTSTELVIEGDYEYIGLRSKSGAMYLNSVEVTWVEKPQPLGFTVALTVGEVGYATLYLGAAAQIPEGVSAYIVTDTSNGYAKMKEVTGIIPANTGVILVAEQGEYEFAFYDKGTADVTGNLLAGTLSHEYIDEEAYVLSAPDGVVGLYKAAMNQLDGTAWQNNANKAYLPVSAVHNKAAAFYGFEWNGTTGIEGVEAEVAQDGAIYDLSGRRVKAITVPGIYIVNGKKVVVK